MEVNVRQRESIGRCDPELGPLVLHYLYMAITIFLEAIRWLRTLSTEL